jgi:hypothetical protein
MSILQKYSDSISCHNLSIIVKKEQELYDALLQQHFVFYQPDMSKVELNRNLRENSKKDLCDKLIYVQRGNNNTGETIKKLSEFYVLPCLYLPTHENGLNCVQNECCSKQHQIFHNNTKH